MYRSLRRQRRRGYLEFTLRMRRYRSTFATRCGLIRVRVVVRATTIEAIHSGPTLALFGIGALDNVQSHAPTFRGKDAFGCDISIKRFRGGVAEVRRYCCSLAYAKTLPGVTSALQTPDCLPMLHLVTNSSNVAQ